MRKTALTLVSIVGFLVALGLVMLASASFARGEAMAADPYYFISRQLRWLATGLLLAMLASQFDYHWLRKGAVPLLLAVFTLLLLGMVFVPGVGERIHGSARWVRLGPFGFQPSELAKFNIVILMSYWMDRVGRRAPLFWRGFVPAFLGLGVFLALIFVEPDYGSTVLVGAVALAIMLAAGARVRYILATSLLGLIGFAVMVRYNPVRFGRIMAFVRPDTNPAVAHQLLQSKTALVRGGLTGVGLGNSIQKFYYLPEAHTDFIFAIIGEELGLIGAGAVVLCFAGLTFAGMIISAKAPDPFGKLLAFGMTVMLSLQALINIGVVSGTLPTKGLALPFISYGGTSLVVSLAAVGVLLNVARHVDLASEHSHTRMIKDAVHRF